MNYPGEPLRRGSTGLDVVAVQRALHVQPTGVYGPTTEACVREFQEERGLEADGVVGPITWAALFGGILVRHEALTRARRYVGTREDPPRSNRGPLIDAWNQAAGVDPGPRAYWCMSFVFSMFIEAAKALETRNPCPRTASCSDLFAWAKRHGKLWTGPARPGDIFLVRGGAAGRTHQHTGFVAGEVHRGAFPSIEGNSNSSGGRNGIEVAHRTDPPRSTRGLDFVRL